MCQELTPMPQCPWHHLHRHSPFRGWDFLPPFEWFWVVEGKVTAGADELRGDCSLPPSHSRSVRHLFADLPNVRLMPNTPDPREFYRLTKIMLVRSLWNESFGLAAAEAICNGIPGLASNRGSLPEIVGEAGFLFDIPARYTPSTREIPSAEEVEPWIETVIRLWDDEMLCCLGGEHAKAHAERWKPDRLAGQYERLYGGIGHQPGAPSIPP